MKKSGIICSVILSIVLLVGIVFLFKDVRKYQGIIEPTKLPESTYVAERDSKNWDTSNPEGYYLFTQDDQRIKIASFSQEVILETGYTYVGNGVFELDDDAGYIIKKDQGLSLQLKEKNPLIFDSYIVFAE